MVIRSVRHRGLRQLLERNNSRFLRADLVGRVRNVLTVLVLADDMDAFLADAPRGWRVHRLSGDRQQEWSVSVSGNWRITFEEDNGRIDDLNLEDYH
ncbi:MAG: plasmid maintenance system killer [Gammaproteobacteria bacterium]|nr:plasmid maintenance system killer [Gammaproteobacteria bacterium]